MAKKKAQTTAIAKWEEELAAQAEAAASQEASTGGGQFFSLKGGVLSINDSPLPDNEMGVIILDSVLENVYYEDEYDPDEPAGPTCVAFGRDEDTMGPDEGTVTNAQAPACSECEFNEWGSADRGKGKACRNRRRLAIISAGDIDKHGDFEAHDELEHFERADIAYLALPPTSINSFGAYVKQLAGVLKRPPHAVFTKIALVSDPKTQFKVTFDNLGAAPNEIIPALMERHSEAKTLIDFPYPKSEEVEKPKKKAGKKKAGKKKAAKKAGSKKTSARRKY